MKTLPTDLPTLIRLAIGDLEKCEKDERYEICMGVWHSANGVCKVCLAGAVMAQTLGAPHDQCAYPDSRKFDEFKRQLDALDFLRCGEVHVAALELNQDTPRGITENRTVPRYADDPAAFKSAMLALADDIEAAQLAEAT